VAQFEAKALENELQARLRAELRAAHTPRAARPRRRGAGTLLARLRATVAPAPAAPCPDEA
jgi:hypothetical protein